MNRFGIVGCGITGAVTALLLKQRLPQINIVIFEKSKGTGGRMCTSRNSEGASVDLGAQFITKTTKLSQLLEKLYCDLLKEGILQPLHENIEGIQSTSSTADHYVCPKGSGSLVKYFLQQLDNCEILFSHKVVKIDPSNGKWQMQCDNGSSHELDAVVLTLPVPQILQLDGINVHVQKEHLDKLKTVEYCSRFALGLFYENEESECFNSIPYSAKFIINDPIIRFYSLDNRKRSIDNGLPSVVIHTTKDFGKVYINNDSSVVQSLILDRLKQLFPQMPYPSEIKFHKWRYSQVTKNCNGIQGCLTLLETPLIICGGDGFTNSTFEGCVHSAESIAQKVENFYYNSM